MARPGIRTAGSPSSNSKCFNHYTVEPHSYLFKVSTLFSCRTAVSQCPLGWQFLCWRSAGLMVGHSRSIVISNFWTTRTFSWTIIIKAQPPTVHSSWQCQRTWWPVSWSTEERHKRWISQVIDKLSEIYITTLLYKVLYTKHIYIQTYQSQT